MGTTDGPAHVHERAGLELESLLVDVAGAIRTGVLEPAEFSDADHLLTQLESVRRGEGGSARARLESAAAAVRTLTSLPWPVLPEKLDETFQGTSKALGFRRALFSVVDGSTWRPASLYIESAIVADQSSLRAYLSERTINLDDAPLEHTTVARHEPQLVASPKTHRLTYKPLMSVSNSRGYATAPVLSNGNPVGMVHADRYEEPAEMVDLERVALACGMLGVLAERMARRRQIADLAERLTNVVTYAEEVLGGRADLRVESSPGPGLDAVGSRQSGVRMTARQLTILRRLAVGATNAQIAHELGISEGTVKSHVKEIYSRLGVHSRAAAAAAYRAGLDTHG